MNSSILKRIRRAIRFAVLAFKDEPVRTWRKLENGKYMCDGDCGRWTLHGVCTCGICHLLKIEEGGRDRIERDTVSWAREGDTEEHMHHVPYRTHCQHGRHLNEPGMCPQCQEIFDSVMAEIVSTWNKDHEDNPITR